MSESTELPRVETDPDDDAHFLFFHTCSEIHPASGRIGGRLPLGPEGWQWQPDGTLRPSIHCLECNTHGFWDGPAGWRPA